MSDDLVLVEVDGPVAVVTLNRPDARNALSRALRKEIFTTLRDLGHDPLRVRDVMLGSSAAPVNSRVIEFSRFGVTTAIASSPATTTHSICSRLRALQPMQQITSAMSAPR